MAGSFERGISAPINRAAEVTTSDAVAIEATRALYVGASGDVVVAFEAQPNVQVTLTDLAGGVWHPIQVVRVFETGTTATGIVAGY